MNEAQTPGGRRHGPTRIRQAAELTDPLGPDEPADSGSDLPVELDAAPEGWIARPETRLYAGGELGADLGAYADERPVGREADYDEDPDLEPDFEPDFDAEYGESEFEPDYGEESDSGPDFGPGDVPRHGRGPAPKLAPGPKHGPGQHPGPPPEHGPGPKKTPAKKVPGKKVPPQKAPAKKVPGPIKHPGPPPEHGPGPGPGGPEPGPGFGFGPGAGFGYGPGPGFGSGFGFGPGSARGLRRGLGSGRRGRRGDVRAAILTLLAERPMHGYEMIREITRRSQELWRPSPGSVYPTLQLLDDEGLIAGTETEGSKKLFELTDQGRTAAEKITIPPWDEVTRGADAGQVNLRTALGQLFVAVTQSAYATTAEQQQRIVDILKKARSAIYTLLAEAE
jgi:DNA-binding PadR family transcriptional regulator